VLYLDILNPHLFGLIGRGFPELMKQKLTQNKNSEKMNGKCNNIRRGLISLWLYKENNKLRDEKICLLYIFPLELHTLMTSLF
jgi:hypothetical protein